MKKSNAIYLLLFLFIGSIIIAQDAENQYLNKRLAEEIKQIEEQERNQLKEKIKEINDRYSNDEITQVVADSLKLAFAEQTAEQIETRTLEKKMELFDEKESDNKIVWNPKTERKINNRLNRFEKKNYLSSDLVFALGINNLVDASSQLEYLEFDYLKSNFIELGWAWKTNLIPESTLLNLRYGFSFQFNSLTTRDNRMFVSYDGNVELLPIDSSIYNHRAKLNYSNLVIPIHLEIGSRNRRKHSYSENGSTVNYYYNPNSLLIGAGVYGGLRLGGKQKLKSNTEGHLAVSEELNLYDIAYGFSGYISFPKFITLYGKLDASPLFKNQSNPSHNVSLGLLFGL